jgi:hypothetical protein
MPLGVALARVGGHAIVGLEPRLDPRPPRIAAHCLAQIVAREILQLRGVASLEVEDQFLARAVDANALDPQAAQAPVDVRRARFGQADVGGRVVADHHHHVGEVAHRQRHARRVEQRRDVAAAEVLILPADRNRIVPGHRAGLHHGVELDQHRQLERARHRERLVAVDGQGRAALEVPDRDADDALREGHRRFDAAPQPIEIAGGGRALGRGERWATHRNGHKADRGGSQGTGRHGRSFHIGRFIRCSSARNRGSLRIASNTGVTLM